MFDLGSPKDPERDFPPSTITIIKNFGGYVNVGKNVSEILVEGGVELGSVEAVVWRYVVFRGCVRVCIANGGWKVMRISTMLVVLLCSPRRHLSLSARG